MEPVPEGWERGVAVVAHPDDLEYGMASAVARFTGLGKTVSYVLATSGEAGIDSIPPERCRSLREEEERRSAALVGVHQVEFLGHSDGAVDCVGTSRRPCVACGPRWCSPCISI